MDASVTLIIVSVFAGLFGLWTNWDGKRESARLDREQGITSAKTARKG